MRTHPSPIYRLAVYGRSGSGKTCLLAVLAMPRCPNPIGNTCAWLPDPPGIAPAHREAYSRGKELILQSKALIGQGKNPIPTRPDATAPRMRYTFIGTTPFNCTYTVELIDYSGELIHTKTETGELAILLRRHLREVDALLVLAEAPRFDEERATVADELEDLKSAFNLLREERTAGPPLRVPVALVFNKWDRRHPDSSSPEQREKELAEFLDPVRQPAHCSLRDTLLGSVEKGCFKVFAASAFGSARIGAETDTEGQTRNVELPPLARPLPSFGLEEPFLWTVRQRDALDVAALNEQASELAWASRQRLFVNAVWFPGPLRLWNKAISLARRYSPENVPPLVHTIRRRARKVMAERFLVCVLVLLSGWLLVEATYDGFANRQAESLLEQPACSAEVAAREERWLETYHTAPSYRHSVSRWFFSREKARGLLDKSRRRREDAVWKKVDAAKEAVEKEQPAQEYLKAYPSGRYVADANVIIQQARDTRQRRENDSHFDGVARDFKVEKARGFPGPEPLRVLDRSLKKVPHPELETKEQFDKRKRLSDEIGRALSEQGKRELLANFELLMATGKLRDAGNLVANNQETHPEFVEEFRKRAVNQADREAREHVAKRRWRDAEQALRQLTEDRSVVEVLGAPELHRLRQLLDKVGKDHDRALYEDVRRRKDLRTTRDYLETGPRKAMSREVKAYQEYLHSKQRKLSLTLRLRRIEWFQSWKGKTEYEVKLNDRTLMDGHANAVQDASSQDVDKAECSHKLDENVKLSVRMKHIGFFKDTNYGEESWEGKVRDLDGAIVNFPGAEKPKTFFALEGVPKEPQLPPYREE